MPWMTFFRGDQAGRVDELIGVCDAQRSRFVRVRHDPLVIAALIGMDIGQVSVSERDLLARDLDLPLDVLLGHLQGLLFHRQMGMLLI